jgi:hypothetical protein
MSEVVLDPAARFPVTTVGLARLVAKQPSLFERDAGRWIREPDLKDQALAASSLAPKPRPGDLGVGIGHDPFDARHDLAAFIIDERMCVHPARELAMISCRWQR